MPDFQNRKMSGSVAYHCTESDISTVSTSTINCEITAKARGYKWDVWNGRQNIGLRTWRPFIKADTIATGETSAGQTITATAVTRDLDDNCLRVSGTTTTGNAGYPGFWDWVTRNQYHYQIPTAGATDNYTYAQSNFISRVAQI